jgi:hypothetical protein
MADDSDLLIAISTDEASDSWGFVGVVKIGDVEAYRTIEAFPSHGEALRATQALVAGALGELLAGQEWRSVREATGKPPLRKDFNFSAFRWSRGLGKPAEPPTTS